MKRATALIVLLLLSFSVEFLLTQTRFNFKATYAPPVGDTTKWYAAGGPMHVRSVKAGFDTDRDGKIEVVATDYYYSRVHLFEHVGRDTLELVWSSPAIGPARVGRNSTPRDVVITDLDGDGLLEITFAVGNVDATDRPVRGIYVYEWRGTVGVNSYGDPAKTEFFGASLYYAPPDSFVRFTVQSLGVDDVDGDNKQELIVVKDDANNTREDVYIIYSLEGTAVEDPFSTLKTEFFISPRAGYGSGSPWAFAIADLDGDRKKEIVFNPYNFQNVFIVKAVGPDRYVIADTTSPKRFYHASPGADGVSLLGAAVIDIDRDGNDEVFLVRFPGDQLHIVNYNPGDNVLEVDSTKVVKLFQHVSAGRTVFSVFAGNQDGDNRPNLYIAGISGYDVIEVTYNGGNILDSSSYSIRVLYSGDSLDVITPTANIRDTLFVIDSLGFRYRRAFRNEDFFVARLAVGANVDLDRNMKREIVLGYQSIPDSVTMKHIRYDATSGRFLTDTTYRAPNTFNRRIIRVLESDVPTGIRVRDVVVVTPDDYELYQNYPNPFNPYTNISFYLPIDKKISLIIYDVTGREVIRLIDEQEFPKGKHNVVWDGKDQNGKPVASGTYFYKLKFGNFEKTRKMMLVK
ncbi:MAG: FG-GAP-like repeat-containing protein [Candidatus Kryptonium sp.]|nr:FG-GAP-like repeat-containing protein [Candidatus Kryptonium sp.]